MELKDQVVSLELAKKLKELGFTDGSIFHWRRAGNLGWQIEPHYSPIFLEGLYPAYTVAELGEMLPTKDGIYSIRSLPSGQWCCTDEFDSHEVQEADTEADARAKMLIYLAENNLIKL